VKPGVTFNARIFQALGLRVCIHHAGSSAIMREMTSGRRLQTVTWNQKFESVNRCILMMMIRRFIRRR